MRPVQAQRTLEGLFPTMRLPTTDPCFITLLSMKFLARTEEKWSRRLGLGPSKNFEE